MATPSSPATSRRASSSWTGPAAASVEREGRRRERQLQTLAPELRAQAVLDQDRDDARSEAYLRLFGVLLGGIGLATALNETASAVARYLRSEPPANP